MEKSGLVQLTQEEFDLFSQGIAPERVMSQWGFSSLAELTLVLASGQYEIVNL